MVRSYWRDARCQAGLSPCMRALTHGTHPMPSLDSIHNHTKEIAAVKVLNLEVEDDEMDEIQKEIQFLSKCDSDAITRYHASFLVGMKLWIVMDYCGAGSIRAMVRDPWHRVDGVVTGGPRMVCLVEIGVVE